MIYKKSWKYFLIKANTNHSKFRLKSLKDFGNVSKGDIGGYVDGFRNLSQSGDCWIYDDAKAFEHAKVLILL